MTRPRRLSAGRVSRNLPGVNRLVPALILLAGCAEPGRSFPNGFQWGIATAAHQSEGRNVHSDWQVFEDLGRAPKAGLAQNSWELYDEDAASAQSVGLNAFQFGIEWARVVPRRPADPFGELTAADLDADAVAHYHQVLASLRARGLTPIVAVTHFSLPAWVCNPRAWDATAKVFTDSLGCWTSADTGRALGRWAEFLAKEYGDEVQWWITVDEPMVNVVAGYMSGDFPPGLENLSLEATNLPSGQTPIDVIRHLIDGHARAYHAIKAVRPDAKVSIAQNSVAWEPVHGSDRAATERVHRAYNLLFLDGITAGTFDPGLIGTGQKEQHPDWAGTADWIGVNYYDSAWVVDAPNFLLPIAAVPCSPAFKNAFPELLEALGCPDKGPREAPGLKKILLDYQQRYGLPMIITESGFIDSPEGKAEKLTELLGVLHEAIEEGADVRGYHYWSLNHTYEWNSGWTEDMGLFTFAGLSERNANGDAALEDWAPDATTDFTRVPLKAIVEAYRGIASTNRLPP